MRESTWKAEELSCDGRGCSEYSDDPLLRLEQLDIDDDALPQQLAKTSTDILREARENDDVSGIGSDPQ